MSVGLALLTSIGQNRIDELTALINDPARRDALVASLGHPEFVGVDPRNSLPLVDLLERWSRGQAADVLRLVLADRPGRGAGDPAAGGPGRWARPRRVAASAAAPAQETGSATTMNSPQLRL